jgi:hypothetical protein
MEKIMDPRKSAFIILVILLLFSTGCNLSSVKSTPTAAAPLSTVPLSLAQLYRQNIQSGRWTEGQGLVELLGMYTGSSKAAAALGNSSIDDFELTGLMRLAADYLVAHPTDSLHDQLQHQVSLLEAPLDKIINFSQKGSLSSTAGGMASLSLPVLPSLLPGDQATCQDLWANGFTSSTPVVCFEYDDQTVGATPIRLFYPSWWAPGDPQRVRLEPLLQAAVLAVRTFNAYGPDPLPAVTLVVTELPGTDPVTLTRSADLLAMAVPVGTSPMNCYVGIFPSLFTKTVAQSQQALAHEMFHCYQYQNLHAQEHNPARSATAWWVEGSAEYFSNVVYPDVNYEWRWLGDLSAAMQDSNLFTWEYKAFIFFQYLENRPDVGTNGVLSLLRLMPSTVGSGVDQQMAMLTAYPNMQAIFHEFGEAVGDQGVLDSASGHPPIPLDVPTQPDSITEVTPGNIFGMGPFTLDFREIIFPKGQDYAVNVATHGDPGLGSARLEDTPHAWGPLPDTVLAGCDDVSYLLMVTQVYATTDVPYEYELHAAAHPSTDQCSCLTGTWLMDDTSYLTHLNGLIAQAASGTVNYTSVDGSDLVKFTSDGHVEQQLTNLVINADMNVSGLAPQTLVISMDGSSNAGFTAVEGQLTYTGVEGNIALTTLLNNQPLTTSMGDYFSSGPLGTGATFICSNNSLTLVPIYPGYSNLPPLTFSRQP